jgi:hypothetical protein
MKKVSKYVYFLLKNTFVITAISLLLAWLGGDGSFFEILFGSIGFFGAILTINLFFVHVLVVILGVIFRNNDSNS